jgi:acetyl-CoA carboxylase carboxyl transferase subunit beta
MSKVLWTKCDQCGSILYIKHLKEHYHVCLNCSHHLQLTSQDRIEYLIDENTWKPFDNHLQPCDPLNFKDQKAYSDRLVEAQERTGLKDAVQTGIGNIEGIPVALGVMDFHFMGGSMGSVVGEKITRLIEHATQLGLPVILVCASGGARMQEGILSLMQMAKISAALHVHQHEANLFYLSVLTSPTTGGVTASFAMLGDLILAEPKALIGFAGRRVIEQTLQEKLPDNFQTSEYLLKHGLLDLIVPRPLLKQALAELLILYKEAPLKRRGQISYGVKKGLYPEFDKKLRQEWRKKPNETTLKKVFDSLKSEGFSLSEEEFKELMTSQEGNSDSLFEKALQLVSKSGVEWSLPSK